MKIEISQVESQADAPPMFSRWLRRSLLNQYGSALNETLPPDWLDLISDDRRN